MNILIVDDEVQLVKAVSAILKKNNFNTDYALDGEDGLDKALLLRGEDALEHVLTVGTGQDHPHGTGHLGYALQDRVEIFQFHIVISDPLYHVAAAQPCLVSV